MTLKQSEVIAWKPLLKSVRECTLCEDLPLGPRPILQGSPGAKILIVGQAPGRITHAKGIPFDDPSGTRLRDWMGIDPATFYDESQIAILPMGFCFPGTGKSGDLPPRPECATQWRKQLLAKLKGVELTLIIGKYAMDWHLGSDQGRTLTATVENWERYLPEVLPMPHPSPRNMRWMSKNDWFAADVLPVLKQRVAELLS
ncbi:MAG: uracil-DNA glycosylase family protein [Halioglobus sp.]